MIVASLPLDEKVAAQMAITTNMTMADALRDGSRLKMLTALQNRLAYEIDACDKPTVLVQLVKQLRDTSAEIAAVVDASLEAQDSGEAALASLMSRIAE